MSLQRLLYKVFFWVCTFLWAQNALAENLMFGVPSDTLIIDGDTIYVEKEEILFAPDSFPERPTLKKVSPARWSAALAAGMNLSNMAVMPFSESQLPLNNFLSTAYKPMLGWTFGAEAGARFLTFRGSAGTIEIAGVAAAALQQARFQFSSIENPGELSVDSTVAYSADNGELLLQYFTLTEPPNIGEVDSIYPQLAEAEIRFGLRDVSAKFRATFYRKPNAVRYFVETGVTRRNVELSMLTNDFYLIQDNQAAVVMDESRWRTSNILVPHFAFGAEKIIQPEGMANRTFWTLGATFQLSAPAATIVRSEQFSIELRSFSLSIYGRFFF